MDLVKQYIIQSISAASNNLRLNPQKIEVVALLRDVVSKSNDLECDIKEMKKITEFSKLAIRLHEIYNYLTQSHVDFFRISDKFKEHSQYLIKDLSYLLDVVSPALFNNAVSKLYSMPKPEYPAPVQDIDVDLSRRKSNDAVFEKSESEILREKILLEEEKEEEDLLHNYEEQILKPIKPLDNFLQKLSAENIDKAALEEFRQVIQVNAESSAKIGFDIIAGMHNIVSRSLELISSGILPPERHNIESIRACLIVIVAVVRGKEIDITNYLNRAEEFGRDIQNIN